MYLKKDPIDYLSEESLEKLEQSEGAVILVHKLAEHSELSEKHIKNLSEFRKYDAIISEKKKEIEFAQKQSFVKRFIHMKTVKEKVEELKAEIEVAKKKIEEVLEEDKRVYEQMIKLEREVNSFKQMIRRFGIKPQEIVDEYHKIKKRFQAERKGQGSEESEQVGPQM